VCGPERCCGHQAPRPARPVPDSDCARTGLLTGREQDVLRGLMAGASNAEIALSLHLGVGTVKAHVQHLLAKLEVRNRQQAVVYAYEVGFGAAPVEPPPSHRHPPAGTGGVADRFGRPRPYGRGLRSNPAARQS